MSRSRGPAIDPRIDPEGKRLPIKLDSTSNGEFVPVPLSGVNRAGNRLAHDLAFQNLKRLSLEKRRFLGSACGAASTLLGFNTANRPGGKARGFFAVLPGAGGGPQAPRGPARPRRHTRVSP